MNISMESTPCVSFTEVKKKQCCTVSHNTEIKEFSSLYIDAIVNSNRLFGIEFIDYKVRIHIYTDIYLSS